MKPFALKNRSNEPVAAHHRTAKHVPVSRGSSAFPGRIPYIQRKPACPCDGGCPRCSNGGVIQPKLIIGQPNDKYEREADRVADQVMRMSDGEGSLVNGHLSLGRKEKESPLVQRKAGCSSCGDIDEEQIQTKAIGDGITPLVQRQVEEEPEEEEEPVQAKSLSNKSPPQATDAGLHSRIQSMRGRGQTLSAPTRAFFEPRFGRDFSNVRVHTDGTAVQMNRELNAQAFTAGKNVFFHSGKYSPGTSAGKHLLAHELTHVVQQGISLQNRPVVQRRVRDSYVTCQNPTPDEEAIVGDNPVGTIQAADTRAIEMADEILEELTYARGRIVAGEEPSTANISDGVSAALQARYRLDPNDRQVWTGTGPGTVALLITRLQNVRKILNGGWIRYTCLGPDIVNHSRCSGSCCATGRACSCEDVYRIWLCQVWWNRMSDEDRAITLLHEAFHVYYGWPSHPGHLTNACCLHMFVNDIFDASTTSGCTALC